MTWFTVKPGMIEALQYDGTEESAEKIIAWVDSKDREGFLTDISTIVIQKDYQIEASISIGEWALCFPGGYFGGIDDQGMLENYDRMDDLDV